MKKYARKTESPMAPQFVVRFFAYKNNNHPSRLLEGTRPTVALILTGTFFVVSILLLLLLVSWLVLGNTYIIDRLIICFIALFYLAAAAVFLRKGFTIVTAWMLLGLYAFLASMILALWSINAPVGILILGFVIILAGVMLGARYIIPVTAAAAGLLICLQLAAQLDVIHPDHTSLRFESSFGDVAGYIIIFAIFAVVSWVSGRRMELSLKKALTAEAELEKEKSLLAVRLEEQTKRLRESQLKEMQQLYHFAEMGQQSTAVLHELANSLAVLTLDIEDIEEHDQQSAAVSRARENIDHLDAMVRQVRTQLQDDHTVTEFNVTGLIKEAIGGLEQKATKAHVTLRFDKPAVRLPKLTGDPLRLSQVISILVTNAIESYAHISEHEKTVTITAKADDKFISILVQDNGSGISAEQRKTLFQPQRSTKNNGLGIGLYIAKSITKSHFRGSITLSPKTDVTLFIIKIPRVDIP